MRESKNILERERESEEGEKSHIFACEKVRRAAFIYRPNVYSKKETVHGKNWFSNWFGDYFNQLDDLNNQLCLSV